MAPLPPYLACPPVPHEETLAIISLSPYLPRSEETRGRFDGVGKGFFGDRCSDAMVVV